MRSIAAVLLVALVAACSADQQTPSFGPTPTIQPTGTAVPTATLVPTSTVPTSDLQATLDQWRAAEGVEAAVLGIRSASGETQIVASGQADELAGTPLEVDDRFRIGSITKTFVAVVILRLAEQGHLRLDDRLERYLPAAPYAGQVTIRQLLNHTSGVPEFGLLPQYRSALLVDPAREWTAQDTLEVIEGLPLDFDPGTDWAYSNTNYVVLGAVAEEITGDPLAQVLRDEVSGPLGLDDTYLEEEEEAPTMRVAGHFDLNGDGTAENVSGVPYTALVTSGAAAGGLSASALDVLDFASGLFEGQLIDDITLAEMLTLAPPAQDYGLGIERFESDGRTAWGHGGGIPGFTAVMLRADDGTVVVALANQTGVDLQSLVELQISP